MVVRQIKERHWEYVYKYITTHGRTEPLSLQFDIDIYCNGINYILKVQLEQKRRIAALQATGVYPDHNGVGGKHYELIEDNFILSALLEIIIYQTINQTIRFLMQTTHA